MIGIFDSGYGGLTILRALVEKLPAYDYVYFGDNARANPVAKKAAKNFEAENLKLKRRKSRSALG